MNLKNLVKNPMCINPDVCQYGQKFNDPLQDCDLKHTCEEWSTFEIVSKTTLKAVVEWLEAPCEKHFILDREKTAKELVAFSHTTEYRYLCPQCWQELRQQCK
jgi:hypothetical protein